MTQSPLVHLSESAPSPLPATPEGYLAGADYRDRVPIVIDHGSSELRAGFATAAVSSSSSSSSSSSPAYSRYSSPPSIHFPPIVSKYRDRRRNAQVLLIGPQASLDTESRSKARGPTEGGLIVAQDVLENVLDFTFSKLGISAPEGREGNVDHPIVLSEPMCNPGYCRGLTSELLFEAYGVPEVSYGLDSLFAAYANDIGPEGVIVSSGTSSTTFVPMIGGRGILGNAKRMNWGGSQASDYLLRLLQLKYPAFPVRLNASQSSSLLETPSLLYSHPQDYHSHIASLADLKKLQAEGQTVQIPFVVPEGSKRNQISEEERLKREERKKEAGKRLRDMTEKNRLQKLGEKEEQLRRIAELKDWKGKERKAEWQKRLESAGYDTEQDMDKEEKKLSTAVKRSRRRDQLEDDVALEPEAPPTFPLVEVPDHELTEEQIKEKRRQRLMKAGYDARMRVKAEKLEERRIEAERIQADEERRANDPDGWAAEKRREYEDVIERMKERKRKKELLSDRKSLAAQQRMKNIASLASDGPGGDRASPPGGGSRNAKRKRAGANGAEKDDGFGQNDEDWAIYRDIQGAEDSDEEEEDEDLLVDLEENLLKFDAGFTRDMTLAARIARKRALTRTFLGGTPEGYEEKPVNPFSTKSGQKAEEQPEEELDEEAELAQLAKQHQITLNVERARVAEVFFQPSLAGVDQAGLDEIVEMVVKGFPEDGGVRERMVSNIFLTGRHTLYPNLDKRLQNSLVALLPTTPYGSAVRVRRAIDPRFDAWRGMARWCLERGQERKEASVTREMYDEYGAEYIKDHPFVSAMI